MTSFYSLASSSSGNSSVYCGGGRVILIDAGTTTKYIKSSLAQLGLTLGDITDVLITHTHSDHISALPVLTKQCRAPVLCSKEARGGLLAHCNHDEVGAFAIGEPFWLGEVCISPFATPHDCLGSCGFTLEAEEGKLAYCTDLGKVTPQIFDHLSGASTLFLESNHDVYMLKNGQYPYPLKKRILSDNGHLSNEAAAQTICALASQGLSRVILAHLSEHNNTIRFAMRETTEALDHLGLLNEIEVTVAPHKELGPAVMLERCAG